MQITTLITTLLLLKTTTTLPFNSFRFFSEPAYPNSHILRTPTTTKENADLYKGRGLSFRLVYSLRELRPKIFLANICLNI